jgi:hypothetical protein
VLKNNFVYLSKLSGYNNILFSNVVAKVIILLRKYKISFNATLKLLKFQINDKKFIIKPIN